eukprot:6492424-Amphidinium_carterae.2
MQADHVGPGAKLVLQHTILCHTPANFKLAVCEIVATVPAHDILADVDGTSSSGGELQRSGGRQQKRQSVGKVVQTLTCTSLNVMWGETRPKLSLTV